MDRRRRHHKNNLPKKRRIAEHKQMIREKRMRYQEQLRAQDEEEKPKVPDVPEVHGNFTLKLIDEVGNKSDKEAKAKNPISELLEAFGKQPDEDQDDDTESSDEDQEIEIKKSDAATSEETFVSDNEEDEVNVIEEDVDGSDWWSVHFDTMLSDKYVNSLTSCEIKQTEYKASTLGSVLMKQKNATLLPDSIQQQPQFGFLKDLSHLNIKEKILNNFRSASGDNVSDFQLQLLSILLRYKDLYYPERTFANEDQIRSCYCLHILQHLLKNRNRIVSNNVKIKQLDSTEEFRDQGLTRPKVLVLLPFRDSAFRTINCLLSLLFGSSDQVNVLNLHRFREEFGPTTEKIFTGKPDNFAQTFRGNTDDAFRIGLAITKKSIRLYTDFYQSDLIICSPLSLRMMVGAKGDKERDYDFLSSIEIVVLDQAEMFLMQNWEHILHIFDHLNIQPVESHGTDFSRVKMWALEGYTKYYRQLLLFSSYSSNELCSLFSRRATSYAGQMLLRNIITPELAAVKQIYVACPQTFRAFNCASVADMIDARFKFFTETFLPPIRDSLSHCVIFVSSYFDFVRLRNYFREQELDFTHICEYTKPGKVAQARSLFFHSGRKLLLMTERFHFYNRYKIKGIRHIIFYQLPLNAHLYPELCNLMHTSYQGKKFTGDESSFSTSTIFCKFDLQLLSNVLGSQRAAHLVKNAPKQTTFKFVTEHE